MIWSCIFFHSILAFLKNLLVFEIAYISTVFASFPPSSSLPPTPSLTPLDSLIAVLAYDSKLRRSGFLSPWSWLVLQVLPKELRTLSLKTWQWPKLLFLGPCSLTCGLCSLTIANSVNGLPALTGLRLLSCAHFCSSALCHCCSLPHLPLPPPCRHLGWFLVVGPA